jgi:hypothetical protein
VLHEAGLVAGGPVAAAHIGQPLHLLGTDLPPFNYMPNIAQAPISGYELGGVRCFIEAMGGVVLMRVTLGGRVDAATADG